MNDETDESDETDYADDPPPHAPEGKVEAVVFDFDGLIVDTEWFTYEMVRYTFATFGVDLEVPIWATMVGRSNEDECLLLCEANGWDIDLALFWERYKAIDRSPRDLLPVLPGIVELLDECDAAGIPTAVASGSSVAWIDGHLERVGLRERFDAVAGRDRVHAGKPDPAVYLLACSEVGADPDRSAALEDSGPGIAAALAAGLAVVAVPSRITSHTDLSAAHHTVASAADVHLADLTALVTAC